MLAPPPPEGWCPHFGEIQDPPLHLTCLKLGLSQNAEEINANFLNNVYHTQQKIDWNTKLIDICHIVNLVSCAKTSIEGGNFYQSADVAKRQGSVSGGSWPHLFCFQKLRDSVKYGWSSVKICGSYSFFFSPSQNATSGWLPPSNDVAAGRYFRVCNSLQEWRGPCTGLQGPDPTPPTPCTRFCPPPVNVQTFSNFDLTVRGSLCPLTLADPRGR